MPRLGAFLRPLRCPKVERHPTAPAPSHLPQRRAGRGAIRYLRVVPLTPLNTSCSAIALRAIGQPGARRPPRLAKLVFSATRRTPARPSQGAALRHWALCPAPRKVASPAALGGGGQLHTARCAGAAASLRRSRNLAAAPHAPPSCCPPERGSHWAALHSSPQGLRSLS